MQTATTYHLKSDFMVSKGTLKRNLESNERTDPDYLRAKALLARRTQTYLLDEIALIFGWLITGHDVCVDEHPEDYSPLEVFTCRQKISRADAAMVILAKLQAQSTTLASEGLDVKVERVGAFELTYTQEKATMTGGSTPHSIYRSGQGLPEWELRVRAHWDGYLENCGALASAAC